MSKLTAQGPTQNRPFKPKFYQGKRRGQRRHYYYQCKYQNRYRLKSGDRRMSYRGSAQYGQNYRGSPQYDHICRSDFRKENFRRMQNYRGKNCRGRDIEVTIETKTLTEVEVVLAKDSIHIILEEMIKTVVDQDQV